MKVKICGIHTTKEACETIKSGADYLGLLVEVPKTNLSLKIREAKDIVSKNKDGKFIILSVEKDQWQLYRMIKKISPWGIQLLRPSEKVVKFLKEKTSVKIIPVIHVNSGSPLNKARRYYCADFLLLDSKVNRNLGGTGKTHDWKISRMIRDNSPIPVFLAGGLNKLNVKEAIDIVQPFCIDAESFLRNKQGFRDMKKVRYFIKLVKPIK